MFDQLFDHIARHDAADKAFAASAKMTFEVLAQEYADLCARITDDQLLQGDNKSAITLQMAATSLARHKVAECLARLLSKSKDVGLGAEFLAQRREHQAAELRWSAHLARLTAAQVEAELQSSHAAHDN